MPATPALASAVAATRRAARGPSQSEIKVARAALAEALYAAMRQAPATSSAFSAAREADIAAAAALVRFSEAAEAVAHPTLPRRNLWRSPPNSATRPALRPRLAFQQGTESASPDGPMDSADRFLAEVGSPPPLPAVAVTVSPPQSLSDAVDRRLLTAASPTPVTGGKAAVPQSTAGAVLPAAASPPTLQPSALGSPPVGDPRPDQPPVATGQGAYPRAARGPSPAHRLPAEPRPGPSAPAPGPIDTLTCPQCAAGPFKNPGGLHSHIRSVHKDSRALTAAELHAVGLHACQRCQYPVSDRTNKCTQCFPQRRRSRNGRRAVPPPSTEPERSANREGERTATASPRPNHTQAASQPADETASPPLHHQPTYCKPLRQVPIAAVPAWKSAAKDALLDIVAASNRGDDTALKAGVVALLALPDRLLSSLRGPHNQRAREVTHRQSRLSHAEAAGSPPSSPDATDAAVQEGPPGGERRHAARTAAARIHRQLTFANVSAAAAVLRAQPLADPTAENLAILRGLHPQAPPPTIPEVQAAAIQVTDDDLLKVIFKLKRGKGTGPSGWTYEHIRAMATGTDSARPELLSFVNLVLAGRVPPVGELLQCKLIGAHKQGGTGLRPICVPEALYRLISLCALSACVEVGKALAPLQLAVGIKGGAQIVPQAVRTACDTHTDRVLICADVRNAFNCIDRSAVATALAQTCPGAVPFFKFAYGGDVDLVVPGASPAEPPIKSSRGVRQGDPGGTFWFCVGAQPVATRVAALADTLGYADDSNTVITEQGAPQVFQTITQEYARIGLDVQPTKTTVWSRDGDAAARVATSLGVRHSPDGVVCCGCPIGTPEFVAQYVQAKADECAADLAKLLAMDLPKQDKLLLLRWSLQHRTDHFWRLLEHDVLQGPLGELQRRMLDAVFSLAEFPTTSLPQGREAQVALPTRFGGVGITRTSRLEADAALLSAAALADKALAGGAACFLSLTGVHRPLYERKWHELHDASMEPAFQAGMEAAQLKTPLWAPERRELTPEVVAQILPGAQSVFTHATAACRYDALLQATALNPLPRDRERDLARLRGCASRVSSMWMETLPTNANRVLGDYAVRSGLRHCLGLSYIPANSAGGVCECKARVRAGDYDHAAGCTRLQGGRQFMHSLIVTAVRRGLMRAGVSSSREPRVGDLRGTACVRLVQRAGARADVLANAEPAGLTALDVSVIHPAAVSHAAAASLTPGAAAAKRDAEKSAAYSTVDPHGYHFVPFSVESYGRLGKHAVDFLNAVAVSASKAPGSESFNKERFVEGVYREISVALYNGLAFCYRASTNLLANVAGTHFQDGLPVPVDDDSW